MTIEWILQQIEKKYPGIKVDLIIYSDRSVAIKNSYTYVTISVFNNLSKLISHLQEN